jgi:hypothetical protein
MAVGSSFAQVAPVPEPATMAGAVGVGLLAFGWLRRRSAQ